MELFLKWIFLKKIKIKIKGKRMKESEIWGFGLSDFIVGTFECLSNIFEFSNSWATSDVRVPRYFLG